jgi:hypothetical protein
MSYYVHFTPYNPDHFVEKNAVFPDKYGSVPYGKGLVKYITKPHQRNEDYFRLTTSTDIQCIHLLRGRVGVYENNAVVLNFYDDNGTLLKYINPTGYIDSCGITDPSNGDDLDAVLFKYTISDYPELSGKKKLILGIDVSYGDATDSTPATVKSFITERLWVADTHDVTTCLFEYTNPTNKDDVFFKDLSVHYAYRIDSYGVEADTGGEYVSFIDQTQETINLYGKSAPKFSWDIGGQHGLPFHAIDTIDNALNLKTLRIDGVRYTREDKEFLSIGGVGKSRGWRVAKLSYFNNTDYRTFRRGTITLFTRPDTYPFAVNRCFVSDGYSYLGNTGVRVVDDGLDDDAFVAELNASVVSNGFNGTFAYVGNDLVFTNADGEYFDETGNVDVFNRCLTLINSVAAAADTFRWVLQYPTSTNRTHVANYGGTSSDPSDLLASSGYTGVYTYEYATAGVYTLRLFTRDLEVDYNFTQSTSYPVQIKDVSGSISNATQAFRFSNHAFNGLASLDLSFLANAKNTLLYLYLNNSGIVGITSGWASSLVSLPYKPFMNLQYIDATGNTFTSANVDSFINEFYNSCAVQSGYHYFGINGNTPPAPPTAASSTARSGLTAAFWTVVTD